MFFFKNNFFPDKMENSLFFLLYHHDTSNQLQRNIQYHYHLVYLITLLTNSFKDQDDHATFQFHHKVITETLNDHIILVASKYVIFLFSSDFTYLSHMTDKIPPRIFFSINEIKSLSCNVCSLISVYFKAH